MHLFCFLSQWLYLRITLLFCGINNTAGSYSKMFKQVNKEQGPRKDSFAKENFWRKGEGGNVFFLLRDLVNIYDCRVRLFSFTLLRIHITFRQIPILLSLMERIKIIF